MRYEAGPLVGRIMPGVGHLSEPEWMACFPDEAEGWRYYAACEKSPPQGMSLSAAEVRDNRGLVAAAPLFQLRYRLDTPLQGALKCIGRLLPAGVLEWRVLGVGSPFADRCHVALRPGLRELERRAALSALVALVEREGRARGASLIAYKDLASPELEAMQPLLSSAGYHAIRSLPVAALHLSGNDLPGYLEGLSAATRKDIRRKLKAAAAVRVEDRSDITAIADRVEELYQATRLNSTVRYGDFEELPNGYFRRIAQELGPRALFKLYWVGDELAAFNLLLLEPNRVIDKFLGMRYPLAREHNLYMASWIENVRFCLATRRRILQSGQTAYREKLRLGSTLAPSWNIVKHRNPLLNTAVRFAAPLLAFDRWDPDLRVLGRRNTS